MTEEKLPYDPKLREAMREIRLVLAKHEIGGVVALGSKTHCEFANIMPAWCSIKIHPTGAVRVRLPVKTDKDLADASVGHVYNMRDLLVRYAAQFLHITDGIDKATQGAVDHRTIDGDRITWHDGRS